MTNFNFDEMNVEQLRQLVETLIAKAVKWGRTNQAVPYRVFMLKFADWFENHLQQLDLDNLNYREKSLLKEIAPIVNDELWLEKEDVWDTMGKTKQADNIEKLFRSNYGWTSEQCVFCRSKRYQDSIIHEQDCPIPKIKATVNRVDLKKLNSFTVLRTAQNSRKNGSCKVEIAPLFQDASSGNSGASSARQRKAC